MSIGLIPFLLNPVISNIFYSLNSVKNLIVINTIFIAIQTAILFSFSKLFSGIEALTITWVIIVWINNGALIYYLVRVKNLRFSSTIILKLALLILITSVLILVSKDGTNWWFAEMNTVGDSWMRLVKLTCAGFILLIIFSVTVYFVFRDKLSGIFNHLKK
jgi:peptidoglycan biosynthesis protein MviN/MurJ (putative lipid II flippase)